MFLESYPTNKYTRTLGQKYVDVHYSTVSSLL